MLVRHQCAARGRAAAPGAPLPASRPAPRRTAPPPRPQASQGAFLASPLAQGARCVAPFRAARAPAVRAAAAADAAPAERLRLHNLSPQKGSRRDDKRKGRGYGGHQVRGRAGGRRRGAARWRAAGGGRRALRQLHGASVSSRRPAGGSSGSSSGSSGSSGSSDGSCTRGRKTSRSRRRSSIAQ
jgi:hypothetical protein